jgi:hypothetical protein
MTMMLVVVVVVVVVVTLLALSLLLSHLYLRPPLVLTTIVRPASLLSVP